jgi:hypothetical protein
MQKCGAILRISERMPHPIDTQNVSRMWAKEKNLMEWFRRNNRVGTQTYSLDLLVLQELDLMRNQVVCKVTVTQLPILAPPERVDVS